MNELSTIESALLALVDGERRDACEMLRQGIPHAPLKKASRRYTASECIRTFLRDGFIDRYSGERLLYPGTMRILSLEFPEEFPYQRHWKLTETHLAYWHLYPTIDHVIPVARGGISAASNLVTTSQLRNSAKSVWLLEEIGWQLHPPGKLSDWDGLLTVTLGYADKHPVLLEDAVLRRWHRAAVTADHWPPQPRA